MFDPGGKDECGAIWAPGRFVCEFIEDPTPEDARLITSAPELLAALVRASDSLKVGTTRNVATDTYRDDNELIHQIDAAIAKATGGAA